jgi:hypothetical protein
MTASKAAKSEQRRTAQICVGFAYAAVRIFNYTRAARSLTGCVLVKD